MLSMAKTPLVIRVDCRAGYRGEEEHRRFNVEDRQVDVICVVERWLTPTHRYFKVNGNDDVTYTLRHHPDSGTREIEKTSPA
jgi:hypothetical protein